MTDVETLTAAAVQAERERCAALVEAQIGNLQVVLANLVTLEVQASPYVKAELRRLRDLARRIRGEEQDRG